MSDEKSHEQLRLRQAEPIGSQLSDFVSREDCEADRQQYLDRIERIRAQARRSRAEATSPAD